mmetsp:Transcript_82352/g.197542  ORF Transcript_82352/g.197542 Transcript_82352/m.197542 type:complete len:693 (+) Transcript_82352:3387-5465(+)
MLIQHRMLPWRPVLCRVRVKSQVRLDELARLIIDAVPLVLGKPLQVLQEVHVVQHAFGMLLVGVFNKGAAHLVDGLVFRLHLYHLVAHQQQQPVESQLDNVHRGLVAFQLHDVLVFDGLARTVRLVEVGQGLLELSVRFLPVRADGFGVLLALLGDVAHFLCLLLCFRLFALHLDQQLVGLLTFPSQDLFLPFNLGLHLRHVLRRLLKLAQPDVHTLLLCVDPLVLLGVELLVVLDEAQEAPGCDVDVLPHPGQVGAAHIADTVLERGHQLVEAVTMLLGGVDLEILQEVGADRNERFLGPGQEPIDVDGTKHRGEHLRAEGELLMKRRKGQDHVQIVAEAIQEVIVQVHRVLVGTGVVPHKIVPDLVAGGLFLILLQQPNHLASGEDGVHDLQKALVDHVLVGEDEGDILVLLTGPLIELLQVLHELRLTVGLGDDDLKEVVPRDEGGQPRERLLATAANSHQHRAAALLLDGAVDAHQVHQGILEEDEVHRLGGVLLIEPAQISVRLSTNVCQGLHRLVDLRRRWVLLILGGRWPVSLKVAPPHRGRRVVCQLLTEVVRGELVHHLLYRTLVLLTRQLVREDSRAFMPPKGHQPLFVRDDCLGRLHNALEDAAQLTEVEDVVEPRRCWQKNFLDLGPHRNGCGCDVAGQRQNACAGALLRIEACTKDASVDVVGTHCGWQNHVEEEELGL